MIDILADRETQIKLARERVALQEGIRQNTEQIILQSMTTLLFFMGGVYFAQQNNIVVPLLIVPAVKHSTSELTRAISLRDQQVDRLRQISRE